MSKGKYGKTLRESGYKNVSLIYTDKKDVKQKRNRFRNIIWFNPPFNINVSTNVAKRFLNLIKQHFPKSNKIHAIFQQKHCKGYSWTQNMSSMIKAYNKKVINKDAKELKSCTSELLRVISKSDFIIIGSRLTMKVAQTIPPFQNIYGN